MPSLHRLSHLAALLLPALVLGGEPAPALGHDRGNDPFLVRLGRAFWDDLTAPAYSPPDPKAPVLERRASFPAPFDSPPFPSQEWILNGAPTIGDPNERTPYPLMEALYNGPNGEWWKKSRLQIYGWMNAGGNWSTSKENNYPLTYAIRAKRVELDQAALYFERLPDMKQADHVDWGFRFATIYGLDYRFTTMSGVFSRQLLARNQTYGFDPVMFYLDIYVPQVAEGMNIRVGRYVSIPDIEAQLAIDNLTYTHSLLYSVDPYTNMGVLATIKLCKQWTLQIGINGGADSAIWKKTARPTLTLMAQWINQANTDSIYFGINQLGLNGKDSGKFTYNNLQHFVATWTHKFSEKWYSTTEAYYMYQRDVPGIGFAPEWAIVNYQEFRLTGNTYLTVRNDLLDDLKGQRTGYKSLDTSHTLSVTHWLNKLVTIRPEIRFDRAWTRPVYDSGTRRNQFTFSGDIIFRF